LLSAWRGRNILRKEKRWGKIKGTGLKMLGSTKIERPKKGGALCGKRGKP